MAARLVPLLRRLYRLTSPPAGGRDSDAALLERFVRHRDEAAFAALVARHGPMVLRLCRRVLADAHAAEDAFQATFLVLARKAPAVGRPEALAGWLYGVAHRVSRKAHTASARHRRTAAPSLGGEPAAPHADPLDQLTARELLAALDEEVQRLPAVYRLPVILCCLEGHTQEEAARMLGWTPGSVRGRLERGRRRLHDRLARRGLTLAAGLAAVEVSRAGAAGGVPSPLLRTTVRAVARGTIGARAAALAEGTLRGMSLASMKTAALALTVAVALIGGGVLAHHCLSAAPDSAELEDGPQPPAAGPKPGDRTEVRGDLLGDPLPADAVSRLGTVRFRHGGWTNSVAFSPDGKQLISHGYWDGVRIWDAATGREVQSLLAKDGGWIGGAWLARDGRHILTLERPTGSADSNFIRLRDRDGLKPVREFAVGFVDSFQLSPDGQVLAGLDGDRSGIELWDVPAGRRLRSWKGHEGWIWSHNFSADGKTLVTAGADRAVRLWDVATGKKRREIADLPNIVGHVALSADGALLATVGMNEIKGGGGSVFPTDPFVRVWDVGTAKELRQLSMPAREDASGLTHGFSCLAFVPDGKTLVTSGFDGWLRFWDPAAGKELRRLALGRSAARLVFAPDGKTLVVASAALRRIDLATGQEVLRLPGHEGPVYATALTPDGRTAATAGGDGSILLWDPSAGKERGRLDGHDNLVVALQAAGDGRTLFSTGWDRTVRVWDLATGKERHRFPTAIVGFGFLAVSADGQALAHAPADKEVAVVEVATGKELRRLKGHDARITGAAFGLDGRTLAVWCGDHTAHVWDLAAGSKVRHFPFAEARVPPLPGVPVPVGGKSSWPYTAAVSPDGRWIAYGSQLPFLALHDLATGKEVRQLDKLPDGVSALAFTADGRMLAWGGESDRTVRLVEVATGQQRQRFTGHRGRVQSLTFAADGKALLSGSDDTTALVWDLTGRSSATGPWGGPLTPQELDGLGADLAGADAAAAYRALRRLAASPAEAVPYLRRQLRPVAAPDEQRLARLIADLDSDRFAARESATAELEKLGELAVAAYRKALEGKPSAETRRRLEALLEKSGQESQALAPDRLRTLRALEVLELIGSPEARQVLESLARGADGAWLTREAQEGAARLARRPAAAP
jgi:RNA polymerase sigma factor (sigma-70 family)